MNPKNFFAELKRRNVYKVAIASGPVGIVIDSNRDASSPLSQILNWGIRLHVLHECSI